MLDSREFKVGDIAYIAGGLKSLDLPKDFPYLGLRLRLSGRLNIAGGAVSGTPWTENPMTLIRNVRVFGTKAGGAVEVVNCDAATLFTLAHILDETEYEKTAVSAGAAADYDFLCDIDIPLHIKGKKVKEEVKMLSLLPAWWFDTLQIEVQWRDGTLTADGGLISAGDRTLTLTAYGSAAGSPSISVVAIQPVNIKPELHRPGLMKIYKKTLITESVESAKKEQLNRGHHYRAIIYKALSDTAERATSDTILNNVKVLISGNAKYDWPWKQLKGDNKKHFSLESMPTGYAMLDFARQGRSETFLDTTRFTTNGTSLETELNISGAANNRVEIIAMEVVQPGKW